MASNFGNIQQTMQQAAGAPPPQGAPMPPGAPPDAGQDGGDPQQEQIIQVLHAAWGAGQQGMPFEAFMQQLMGGGGQQGPDGPPPGGLQG